MRILKKSIRWSNTIVIMLSVEIKQTKKIKNYGSSNENFNDIIKKYLIISVIEPRFYNLSVWERREVYQRTFYSTLLVDRRTGHVCFKKSVSIILFHVGYLLPRYYLYATSNLVLIILIKKDPSQKSINRLFRNVLSFKWYFYSLFQMIFLSFLNTNQY